jgi:hypothetical protein
MCEVLLGRTLEGEPGRTKGRGVQRTKKDAKEEAAGRQKERRRRREVRKEGREDKGSLEVRGARTYSDWLSTKNTIIVCPASKVREGG